VNRPTPRTFVTLAALALVVGTVTGCDTRECRPLNDPDPTADCDPDELTGDVVDRRPALDDDRNPTLIVDTNGGLSGGQVRVWLKEEYWNEYVIGSRYP